MSDELIKHLITKGFLTEEDVRKAEQSILTDDKKETLETLHLKYCELNHDNGECQWYIEEQIVSEGLDSWERTDHKHWMDLFNVFISNANTTKLVPERVSKNLSSPSDD